MIRRFLREKTGATAIEYGLIIGVLSLAIVTGIGSVMNSIEFLFANNASKLQQSLQE